MNTATITTADATSAVALAHGLRELLTPVAVARDRDCEQGDGLARLTDAGALLVAPALVEAAEVTRVVASVDPGLAHVLAGHYLAQFAAALVGGDEQRELVGREAGHGRRFSWIGWPGRPAVAASLTENRSRDLTQHRTGGSWSLTAGPARAAAVDGDGWLAVVAQIDGDPGGGERAIALIPSGAEGVTRTEVKDRPFGLRTVAHERVAIQTATVPDHRVLRLGPGEPVELTLIDAIAQLLDAAVELGIGRAAIERTADYVRTRTRAAFEADQERAADEPHLIRRAGDLVVPLYAAETLLQRAAGALAAERIDSTAADVVLLQVAQLRVQAREAAIALTSQSLELAGASATDAGHGLDRFWRDAQSVFVLGSVAWGASVLGERTIALHGRRRAGEHGAARPAKTTGVGELRAHRIRGDAEAVDVAAELACGWGATAAEREHRRAIPEAELREFGDSGIGAITVPAEYGGADVSAVTLANVIATIAAADPSLAQIPQNHFMGVDNLSWAAPETRAFFYEELLRGARFGSAVSERGGRRYEIQTTVTPDGDGYRVNGTKYYCTGALTADWVRVAAKHPDGDTYVALVAAGTPGLTVESDWNAFGQRVTHSGTTRIDDVWVPAVQVIPWTTEPDRRLLGFAISQVIHAAIEAGVAQGSLDEALDVACAAELDLGAGGTESLAQIGRLAARVAAARAIVHRAAAITDAARNALTTESASAAVVAVDEAKALAYDAGVSVSDSIIRLLGPLALDQRLGLDRHWRNARTHSLHDVVRWKYHHAGDYFLNGRLAPRMAAVALDGTDRRDSGRNSGTATASASTASTVAAIQAAS